MIVLKVVLALLLTLVPFVFHYVIKPNRGHKTKRIFKREPKNDGRT